MNEILSRGREKFTLDALQRRDQAIQAMLTTDSHADTLRPLALQLAQRLTPFAERHEGEPDAPATWAARDLLHRVIAWRQFDDPGFLPHPVDVKDLEPVIAHVTKVLAEAHGTDTWPKSAEALDGFLHDLARSIPPPLATTGLEELVAPSDEAARLLWQA